MDEIYYESEDIIAYPTEMSLCVVENKRSYDIYLVFNVDKPLSECRITANGSIIIINEQYVKWIKSKEFNVFWFD